MKKTWMFAAALIVGAAAVSHPASAAGPFDLFSHSQHCCDTACDAYPADLVGG